MYRPFWQSKKDGETTHVLPISAASASSPSVGAATFEEVIWAVDMVERYCSLPPTPSSEPLSVRQGGGGASNQLDHKELYAKLFSLKYLDDDQLFSELAQSLIDEVDAISCGEEFSNVDEGDSAVVKVVVEEVFANVLVHNMVSEICQVLIARDGLQQLWLDVGSGIRDHVALMVRDEHNLACQLNCELAYVDQFLRLGIPCLLSRDNGNLLVSNQIWTRQGTHVHAYLIYYFPWEYL